MHISSYPPNRAIRSGDFIRYDPPKQKMKKVDAAMCTCDVPVYCFELRDVVRASVLFTLKK